MEKCLLSEVNYRTSRSSGPGGQHVNKTESRVELIWDPGHSKCLTEAQKIKIQQGLASRITDQGLLVLASERHRSQFRNRDEVAERFLYLVRSALVEKKKRIRTRPTGRARRNESAPKRSGGRLKGSEKALQPNDLQCADLHLLTTQKLVKGGASD